MAGRQADVAALPHTGKDRDVWRTITIAVCIAVAACSVRQPASHRTVAAFEVPLRSEIEKIQFLDVLRAEAKSEGLHVDSDSEQDLRDTANAIPLATMTINASVWRGQQDDQLEASVQDTLHPGVAWIMFSQGENPSLAKRFRDRVMAEIIEQWPDTRSIPVMPTGALPLREDMVLTPQRYRVKPDVASAYELPKSSPLIAGR